MNTNHHFCGEVQERARAARDTEKAMATLMIMTRLNVAPDSELAARLAELTL